MAKFVGGDMRHGFLGINCKGEQQQKLVPHAKNLIFSTACFAVFTQNDTITWEHLSSLVKCKEFFFNYKENYKNIYF